MIKVEVRNGMLAVVCPYSRTFVSFAKMRGGTWSDGVRQWLFDPRDEFAVRSTLADIYGTDDYESCAKTDVRLALDGMRDEWDGYDRLFVCGREIARRKYYDSYVELGEDVVLIEGGFPRKASYRGEPVLCPEDGTILEVRGVPVTAAEKALKKWPDAVTILGEYDITKLQEERDFHAKRIVELDGLIARYSGIFSEGDVIADLQDNDDEAPANSGEQAIAG